ncbi:MAG: transglutaminase-like domain-containing protein [Planctomycetes bacterium]|nr:transglutaminase-like domain-containing protein [Planctomycetota bacterium]
MTITPGNLEALIHLLDDPDLGNADPLIDQIAVMSPADRDRVVARGMGANEHVRANIESGLIRARYRAAEGEWASLKGVELEQGLILISRTAENPLPVDISATLDAYANEIGDRLSGDRAFDNGLHVLASVLYREHHLRGNAKDYHAPENSYLAHVLHSGLGVPISLCSVAILVARRLELPVTGIGAPGHFLGFYGDADLRIGSYFDPFDGFRRLTAGEIRVLLNRFVETVEHRHLNPVKDREILARFLRNLAGAYAQRRQPEHIRNLERWIRLIPA